MSLQRLGSRAECLQHTQLGRVPAGFEAAAHGGEQDGGTGSALAGRRLRGVGRLFDSCALLRRLMQGGGEGACERVVLHGRLLCSVGCASRVGGIVPRFLADEKQAARSRDRLRRRYQMALLFGCWEESKMEQRAALVDALKRALKARGITYAQVAEVMELSEPSVKRMFASGQFTLERF